MKNKMILMAAVAVITACSTTKKISGSQRSVVILSDHGSTIQLPPNSKKINNEQLAIENQKYKENPFLSIPNIYLADNILIGYHDVHEIKPTDDNFENLKKGITSSYYENPIPGWKVQIDIKKINSNKAFIWRTKKTTEIRTTFFCRDKKDKFVFGATLQGVLADSTKIDNDVEFILKNIKFSE